MILVVGLYTSRHNESDSVSDGEEKKNVDQKVVVNELVKNAVCGKCFVQENVCTI